MIYDFFALEKYWEKKLLYFRNSEQPSMQVWLTYYILIVSSNISGMLAEYPYFVN